MKEKNSRNMPANELSESDKKQKKKIFLSRGKISSDGESPRETIKQVEFLRFSASVNKQFLSFCFIIVYQYEVAC